MDIKPTRIAVTQYLAKLGATLDGPNRDPVWHSYTGFLDAPSGKVWDSHGTHCVAVSGDNAKEFWECCVAELIGTGIDDCDDPNCDICHDEE